MVEILSGAWVAYFFGALVVATMIVALLSRDRRMTGMSLVILMQWLVTMAVIYLFASASARVVYAILNIISFLALIQFNRGEKFDPNLWAFVAIFFEGAMIPSHFPPIYGWLGPWGHSLWVNICYLFVILVLLIGASHRIYLDWQSIRLHNRLLDDD
jgi:hypothetical protein